MVKISRVSKICLAITIAALVTSTAIDSSQAKAKFVISKAGRAVGSVSNTILNGKGTPAASLGINGDFYIDKTSLNLYGPKTNGKWNVPTSLRGAVGPTGPSGLDGKDGAKGTSSTSGASGSTGASGLAGSTGPAGSIGPTGPSGPSGPSGAAGLVGSVGPAGTNGTPGAKGDTGAAGSAKLLAGSVVFPAIIGVPLGGSFVTFGNFEAGKSYLVRLMLHVNSTSGVYKTLGISFSDTALPAPPSSSFIVTDGNIWRATPYDFESSIIAEVIIDGTLTLVTHHLTASISCTESVSSPGLLMVGTYSAVEVGSIG